MKCVFSNNFNHISNKLAECHIYENFLGVYKGYSNAVMQLFSTLLPVVA